MADCHPTLRTIFPSWTPTDGTGMDEGKKRMKPDKGADAAEKSRKKARKTARAEEAAPPEQLSVEPKVSKKARKAARAAEERVDSATRSAATEEFLLAKEQAQAAAQAAKAEALARRREGQERERQAKLAKTGAPPVGSSSYRDLQRAVAVSGAGAGAPPADGSTEMLRGDWTCPGCGAMCFANRHATGHAPLAALCTLGTPIGPLHSLHP